MNPDTLKKMLESKPSSFEDTKIAYSAKSNKELHENYLLFSLMNHNWLVNLGTSFINLAIKIKLPVKSLIKATLFKQFCGGENIQECKNTSNNLAKFNVKTILDYSVEGEGTEESYNASLEEVLQTMEEAKNNQNIPFCVFKPTAFGSAEIMEKLQLEQALTEEETKSFQRTRDRFDKACQTAHKYDIQVFVDAEDSWYQDTVEMLTYEMMEKYNKKKPLVFNTYQMYRTKMYEKLEEGLALGIQKDFFVGAKLVRGAYLEKERVRAKTKNYADPIQPTKEATDEQFDKSLKFCVEHIDKIGLACCSHNEKSNLLLTELMEKKAIKSDDSRFYFAQLFGMSDNISFILSNAGYNTAKYLPYGPLETTLPYLFRRAQENTSIAGQTSRELMLIHKEIQRRQKEKKK